MKEGQARYQRLAEWIREQIHEKKLLPGQRMYSENELSKMFGLSRQTVRNAIEVLEEENLIRRVRGSGTYVNEEGSRRHADCDRVAVIMTYLDGYIFPRTIKAIEDSFFKAGYTVQIAFTNNLHERERIILEDILEKDEVAGIIVEATKSALPNPNYGFYRQLSGRNIPILFINSFYRELSLPHVSINDKQAGKIATEYLIKKGHRKITGMFKLDDGQGHLRYSGYIEAMEEAGLSFDESRICWVDTADMADLALIGEKIQNRLAGHTALVCYNDEVAFSLVKYLQSVGIRIPEDLSIVSIDDLELAVLGSVKLTSVPYPMERLGEKVSENLLKMIQNPRFDGNYEFEVFVNERDSVKDLNKHEIE